MRVLTGRNVNELFSSGTKLLLDDGEHQESRNGGVAVMPHPVMSVYERPTERVLFSHRRDANPFFHLMESLWMLAGRDDAAFLDRYIKDFGSRYANDGVVHGAYGHRWRSTLGFDQLDVVVEKLRQYPEDRQCVIQMWDGSEREDHYGGGGGENDLLGDWKDRPCNTHIYLRVRIDDSNNHIGAERVHPRQTRVLDLTVCCRSNDAVWGAYGANAVHFSVLLEYLAGRIGIGVGRMYQFSNNFHIYESVIDRVGHDDRDPYLFGDVFALPMGTHWDSWDEDLAKFMKWHDDLDLQDLTGNELGVLRARTSNEWFTSVAGRVALARWEWTHGFKQTARATVEDIAASDWRRACIEWMDRRKKCGSSSAQSAEKT